MICVGVKQADWHDFAASDFCDEIESVKMTGRGDLWRELLSLVPTEEAGNTGIDR